MATDMARGINDPLYAAAKRLVIETGNGGTSHLQRRMTIGFNRACAMLDAMEVEGVVSPIECGHRRVLADRLASPGAGAVERFAFEFRPASVEPAEDGEWVRYTDHAAALAARDAEIAGLREELGSTKVILECARRDIAKWRKHTEGLAQEMNDVRTLLAPLFKNVDPMPGDSMIGVSRTVTLYGYASDVAKQLRALRQRVEAAEAAWRGLIAKWKEEVAYNRREAVNPDWARWQRDEHQTAANVLSGCSYALEYAMLATLAAQQAEPTGGRG